MELPGPGSKSLLPDTQLCGSLALESLLWASEVSMGCSHVPSRGFPEEDARMECPSPRSWNRHGGWGPAFGGRGSAL